MAPGILQTYYGESSYMITNQEKMNIQDVLRSINILYDADKVERIAHFQPTSKAVVLLESLLGIKNDKSYFISAPYGSGKSITSTYILHSIENRENSKKEIKKLHERVFDIAPQIGSFLKTRVHENTKGIVLALQGYEENLPDAIKRSLTDSLLRHGFDSNELIGDLNFKKIDEAIANLTILKNRITQFTIDRISIIWDEFGRHIEGLIEDGRPSELNHLQTLAEYASRSTDFTFTIGLLLHQSLMNYAGKTPQSVKKEWKKIEGRYETIQYIDDSKEIYGLIANVVYSIVGDKHFENLSYSNVIKSFHAHKVFLDISDKDLSSLFQKALPLTPAAFQVLPRISSRIAQHERTLFTFLNSVNFSEIVHVGSIYDYFSATMGQDTSVGGVYHQWTVTESALSKVDDKIEEEILKTVCLLGISMSMSRGRISKSLLNEVLISGGFNHQKVESSLDKLLNKKLLLYRKNTDSLTIWHGTEIDLFSKLQDEKDKIISDFNALKFVESLFEPVHWKPVEYNNTRKVHRYFRSEYIGYDRLVDILISDLDELFSQNYDDGKLFFFIPESEEQLEKAKKMILDEGKHPQILWALPKHKLDLFEVSLEVAGYTNMLEDTSLIESDPFIKQEIEHMLDDSMEYLQKVIEISTAPSLKGPDFIHNGEIHQLNNSKQLRTLLSEIMEDVFSLSPILNNELIVKQNLRSALVNGRKKLLFAIMDNTGAKNLNLEGFTPDVSMFRSLLLNSGLYRQIGSGQGVDTWGFAKPSELPDKGLRIIWSTMEEFFTDPEENKPLSDLFEMLKRPPYGVRKGVIPILLASALRAFPSVLSITHQKDGYLEDILPSDLERMCESPAEYRVSVEELTNNKNDFLIRLYELFDPESRVSKREMDLIRKAYDAIEIWKSELPEASMTSKRISIEARTFQELVRSIKDPRDLFLKKLPSKYGTADIEELFEVIRNAKVELEGITEAYYIMAGKSVLSALQMPSYDISGIMHAVGMWTSFLPNEVLQNFKDGMAKALLVRMRMSYDHQNRLIDSISGLLIGKQINKWDDSTITVFERELQENIHRIEDYVLSHTEKEKISGARENLANLALTRIESLYRKITELLDETKAREMIERLIQGD